MTNVFFYLEELLCIYNNNHYKYLTHFTRLLLALQSHLLLVQDILYLYYGITNQDSTLPVCSQTRCYFTSNTLVSSVQTGFRKLDWNTGMA